MLLDVNGKSYQPHIVSMGPFHHGQPHLLMMEEHKWRFLRQLLNRTEANGMVLEDYLKAVQRLESTVRECYSETISYSTDEFVEMMWDYESFLSVNIKNSVIQMPTIAIDDFMCALLLNAVAFEQCHSGCSKHFMAYGALLGCLINTSRDVRLLCAWGIIENYLGTDGEVASFINNTGKDISFDINDCYLARLFDNVNQHYHSGWRAQWAIFKETYYTYFKTPWSMVSALAAVVLLLLTITQTVYTILVTFVLLDWFTNPRILYFCKNLIFRTSRHSKEDQTMKISKSIFIINFLEGCTARDLWKVCNDYGTVVDVFIPFKKSKPEFDTSEPALILDDSCIKEYDFCFSIMGKVKDVAAIPNLYSILSNEGFHSVKLSYLERIIWVEIEGLPIKAWTCNSVRKIASLWGEIVALGDSNSQSLSKDDQEVYSSDDDLQDKIATDKDGDKENIDLSDVSESSFPHANDLVYENSSNKNARAGDSHLDDPFYLYCLLNDQHKRQVNQALLSWYIPLVSHRLPIKESINVVNDHIHSVSSKLKERNIKDRVSLQNNRKGGSILDVMDELVKVGESMGYNMEGCVKNIMAIIGSQGDFDAFR
uniref:Uncharacterized protein n=1 Tax=Tanacetum cinerariifolium TaxID=118510 RepID=A0A699GXT0_TANCI|nr:uncharacterized protein [Tanacetum cinerariifolium]